VLSRSVGIWTRCPFDDGKCWSVTVLRNVVFCGKSSNR